MTGLLDSLLNLPPVVAMAGATLFLGALGLMLASGYWRQRASLRRLDERLTHLTTGLSLLTNTTEEGLRAVAFEMARLSRPADQAPQPQTETTARQRIASAAGHGRSIQDIAASEQLSEGEVLLHLLMDRMQPEAASANVC